MKMKKFMATTLAAALAVSGTVSAAEWNTEGGTATVTGDSGVVQPVIEVALPGDLAFIIDPYTVEYDNQITGYDYNVVNYSNIDVTVQVNPSIVKYEDEDARTYDADGNMTARGTDMSIVEPATSSPGVNDDELSYKDLAAASAGKKAVYLTAIPADAWNPDNPLVDTDGDGIYEFSYTADVGNVGRTENAYIPADPANDVAENFAYGAATAGTADGAAYVLGLEWYGDKGTPNFTYVLAKEAGTTDADTEVYTPAAASVGSFTVGGAVDTKAALVDGDVEIQAVYKLATLTVNEKADLDANGMNANKQQLKN